MEGGAANDKDAGLASDLKKPNEEAEAGAPPGGVVDPHAQNQAQAGDKAAEVNVAAYKDDGHVAPGGESYKQNELGARGVPLGKKGPHNDQGVQIKDEERSLDKEKEKIESVKKKQIEKDVQERLEKQQLEREIKEKIARDQELEKERIEKEVQARLEKERLEREKKEKVDNEQELLKQRAERQKIEKEMQDRLEKEQLERERKEKLSREQALEKERIEKEVQARVEKERLDRERREKLESVQQEIQEADNEILDRARKEMEGEKAQERLAQLERVIEAKNAGKAAQGAEGEDNEALKKGGRDLKEKVAAQANPREGVEDGAVKAGAHPQASQEKVRDQGEMDLRRKRRAVGPRAAGGPPEETRVSRGVPGLEPLLELGGSDLHVALEEQLLAGAMVHSRQIKQASEDKGVK